MSCRVSLIVPVLDDAEAVSRLLVPMQSWRGDDWEIIVVDGGSQDASRDVAQSLADTVIEAPRGRAAQMQCGARAARGEWLWFVHADSLVSGDLLAEMRRLPERCQWGRCDVVLDDPRAFFSVIAFFMNNRSWLTGICTGDQGIFVRNSLFHDIGGYAMQPLMEDVELSARLRKVARPHRPRNRLVTAARRWQSHGVLRTLLLMWWLRLQYFLGVPASRLHQRYYPSRDAARKVQ